MPPTETRATDAGAADRPLGGGGSGAERAAHHLRGLPLQRWLREAWQRLPRYGLGARIPGILSVDERQTLESLLRQRVPRGRAPSLAQLDQALRDSPFACGLAEALEALFGPLPLPPGQVAAAADRDFLAFVAALGDSWASAGTAPMMMEGLRREFQRARTGGAEAVDALERSARVVDAALRQLQAERSGTALLLPVLANAVAGDPHALDAGTAGGRLLMLGLGGDPGMGAADRQALFAQAGLAVDGISSAVALWGIGPAGDPAAQAAAVAGHAHLAPLRQVARWRMGPEEWAGRTIHTVENPAVFEALIEHGLAAGVALLCTSGFPSAATLVALRQLAAAGARISHSGDFDAKGLMIARRVLDVASPLADLWRMSPEDYRAACRTSRGRPLRVDENRTLATLSDDPAARGRQEALGQCAAAVLAEGAVAYQESLITKLWDDLSPP